MIGSMETTTMVSGSKTRSTVKANGICITTRLTSADSGRTVDMGA